MREKKTSVFSPAIVLVIAISLVFVFGLMGSPVFIQQFETFVNQNPFDIQKAEASLSLDDTDIDVWQLREHNCNTTNCPPQSVRVGFRVFNNVLEANTADSDTVHISNQFGTAYVFKVFNKTDIQGKDILVNWEGFTFGSTANDASRIEVCDGAFDRNNNTQFPDNAIILCGVGDLGNIQTPFFPLAQTNTTLPESSINYAISNFPEVTVFLRLADSHTADSHRTEIHFVQIGNGTAEGGEITLYSFTNPIVEYTDTDADEAETGLVRAGSCTGQCPPLPLIPPPPPSVTCNGLPVTIQSATSGDDFIVGTPGDDVINGLGGNDFIIGKGGDDTICGGDGNDFIFGSSGDDLILGDAGEDFILGNSGDDSLKGNLGDDRLAGGSGNDAIEGNEGDDNLIGDAGDDSLDGGTNDDFCEVSSGEIDTITNCENPS